MISQHELDYALDWEYFDRFLLTGSEPGAYETPALALPGQPTPALDRCLAQDGLRAVREASNLLVSGRACRPEPALYVIAKAIATAPPRARQEALELVPYAARTGAQLFQLVAYLKALTRMDRPTRQAIGTWYTQRTVTELVNLILRSPEDAGSTHREILGLADSKPPTPAHAALFRWVTHGQLIESPLADPGLELLAAHQMANTTNSEPVVLALLRRWPALREVLPETWLTRPAVWRQILPCLSTDALVRWLPRMAELGLLGEGNAIAAIVAQRLQLGALGQGGRAAFSALAALGAIEETGRRHGGAPSPAIADALLKLFHHRLAATRPTAGTLVIAIDPGASSALDGLPQLPGLSPRAAMAALALMAAATAQEVHLLAFGRALERLELEPGERIESLLQKLAAVPQGAVDGATPVDWALESGVEADAFLILSGTRPKRSARTPDQALLRFRERTGRHPEWLAVSLGAHRLCETPPLDLAMLEAHGFDATVPALVLDLLSQGQEG